MAELSSSSDGGEADGDTRDVGARLCSTPTPSFRQRCQEKSIETVFDLVEMEDDKRGELLQMSDSQLMDITTFCNRFPNIDMSYDVVDGENIRVEEEMTMVVTLEREGRSEAGPVDAARYPKGKEEGWWLVVGDTKSNQLLAIKRVSLQRKAKVKLDNITAPSEVGKKSLMLYLMCDSYMGCDQEYPFTVDVK